MILSLDTDIQARSSFGDVIRSYRSFTPEGFSEKVWIIFEGNKTGKELFDEVCEKVFEEVFENAEESVDSPIARFEKAMRKLNKKVDTSVRLPEDFLFNNSFAILLSVDNEIHFTTLGNSEVYFIRKGKVMHVSDGISAQTISDELFLNVASGELQDEDVMIFSTLKLLKYLTHAQMQEIAENDSHEIIATLNEFIGVQQGGVSGCIVAHGALPLPFEETILHENSVAQSGEVVSSVFSPVSAFCTKIKHAVEGRVPQEILFLGVGVLVLFLVWSGIGMLSGGVTGDTEKYKTLLREINTEIGIADSIVKDHRESEALLKLAAVKLKAEDALQNSTFPVDSQRYLNKIVAMEDDITNTTRISGNAFADISVENENDILAGVFFFDKEMYSFSAKNLYRIIGKNIENVIPLKEEEIVIKAIPLEKKQEMVFLTERGVVLEVSKTEVSYAKTDDTASWKPNAKNIGFYDRNIYILSPENNEIYKYKRGQDTYSKPSAYNKNSDLQDALDITIDGNIFVLKKGGVVLKLLKGVEQEFEIKKAPNNFVSVTEIITSVDSDLLLFLSPTEKTVFVFKKNSNSAVYKQQIVVDVDNEELSGLAIDSETQRIIVSGKQKLYEIPLITQ
ncbi:TPA: hypothetical protein EYG96_01690 [Candidatus Gracilibacteria bacterium]|nr:hypothetical protein [Candidatus Peregrinibacteria bacterium]HIQ56735.1 hypothetical protein [Candidatus Gracilibacteria bacterium]HIQ57124.1 hypothetical protein [Candidatus Gracilibacteria bacterium]